MPVYDENDPKLAGYKPVEDYRKKDMDRSSRRIRDMPYGRRKEDGLLVPSEMNFGTIDIDDLSASQTATLMNKGYDTLKIKSMSVVGDFLVTTDCGSELEPGESCSISIQFNPKREGILTGGIYVDTGDASGTEFIKLLGSGKLSDVVDPAQVTRFDYRFTLASGQAVVTGEDDYGHILDYVQDHVDVSLNGAELVPGVDFLAVGGESLTLTEAAFEGDELLIRAWSTFEVANTYTQTQIDTKVDDAVTTAVSTALSSIGLSVLYPVGSLYFNASDGTNPATLLGFGTWVSFGAGRVPIGVGTFQDSRGEVRTFAAGDEGGAYQHLLVEAEMPDHTHTGSTDTAGSHTHSVSVFTGEATGGDVPWVNHNTSNSSVITSGAGDHTHSLTIDSTGGDTPHNNMQPYIAVYIWLRTA